MLLVLNSIAHFVWDAVCKDIGAGQPVAAQCSIGGGLLSACLPTKDPTTTHVGCDAYADVVVVCRHCVRVGVQTLTDEPVWRQILQLVKHDDASMCCVGS